MKLLFLTCIVVMLGCKPDVKSVNNSLKTAVSVEKDNSDNTAEYVLEVYDYDGLKPLLYSSDNRVHVVNFWATWCAPCVKELPYFEALHDHYSDDSLTVVLVSLDFPNQYRSKLKPFIKKHRLKSKVVAFDDVNQNRWIPAIHKSWTGALPATLIYKGNQRQFFEGAMTPETLDVAIQTFLNPQTK